MLNKIRLILARHGAYSGIGQSGESRAADFLKRYRGFRILARNWRNPKDRRDELDLVCMDGPVLVIVEVKTRYRHALVRGLHSINWRKKRALQRAVWAYLRELGHGGRPKALRFDVVEVMHPWDPVNPTDGVVHLENIPLIPNYRA